MTDPAVAALEDVVADLEQAVETLNGAADAIEDGELSPAMAQRFRSWAIVLAAPIHDAKRVVGSLGKTRGCVS